MNDQPGTVVDPLQGRIDVSRILGVPGQVGDVALIPVAELTTRFGYGFGARISSKARTGKAIKGSDRARRMGYLRVAEDGVEFEPMLDLPAVSLASLCLVGWILFWVAHMVRDLKRGRR